MFYSHKQRYYLQIYFKDISHPRSNLFAWQHCVVLTWVNIWIYSTIEPKDQSNKIVSRQYLNIPKSQRSIRLCNRHVGQSNSQKPDFNRHQLEWEETRQVLNFRRIILFYDDDPRIHRRKYHLFWKKSYEELIKRFNFRKRFSK